MAARCSGISSSKAGHSMSNIEEGAGFPRIITTSTKEDYSWLEGLNDNAWTDFEAQAQAFKRLSQGLAEAVEMAVVESDEVMKLAPFCTLLPGVIKKCIEITPKHLAADKIDDMQSHMIDIFSRVMELVVAILANPTNHVNRTPFMTHLEPLRRPSINNLLKAFSYCLNLGNQFYEFRQRYSIEREIVVHASMLTKVLQVPGCLVKVSGACDGKVYYYCSQSREVNHEGISCSHDCCTKLPVHQTPDVLLTYLAHLFGTSSYGNGYKHILDILQQPQHLKSFVVIGYFLGPLTLLKSMRPDEAERFLHELQEAFEDVAYKIFRYLKLSEKQGWANRTNQLTNLLHQLHTATCWEPSCTQVEPIGLACHLQIMMWNRWVRKHQCTDLCMEIGDATNASFRPPLGASILLEDKISNWLEKEDVLNKLLIAKYDTQTEVIKFVEKIGKIGLLQEQHVQKLLQQHPRVPYELIIATALEGVHMDAFANDVLESVFQWLNLLEDSSSVTGHRALNILSKLVVADRKKILQHKRLMDLFWKHACNIPTTDLAPCLTALAGYQIRENTVGTSSASEAHHVIPRIEEEANFLEKCVEADRASDLSDFGTPDQTELYVQKAKVWAEKEHNLYCKSIPNMESLLGFDMPMTRQEISQECMHRLGLAQDLASNIYKDSRSTLGSSMPSVMSTELHTWNALKMETSIQLQLGNRLVETSNNNLKEFEEMKERHHVELSQLFDRCKEENNNIVKEALCLKAQVVAGVEKGKITTKLSSHDILTRMLQKAENVVEEVVQKPNSECAICSMGFTPKRKRACFGPCGHARACIQCATREYKKRKHCPFCNKATDKPRMIPHKLLY